MKFTRYVNLAVIPPEDNGVTTGKISKRKGNHDALRVLTKLGWWISAKGEKQA